MPNKNLNKVPEPAAVMSVERNGELPQVFLLEPDRVLAKAYGKRLTESGVKVHVFHTAQSAIKAFEIEIPDVVVLELALPAHGGFEFLYEMISYSDTKNVKVIINSSVQESRIPWGIINRGDLQIVEYLYKPLSHIDELVRVLKEQLASI